MFEKGPVLVCFHKLEITSLSNFNHIRDGAESRSSFLSIDMPRGGPLLCGSTIAVGEKLPGGSTVLRSRHMLIHKYVGRRLADGVETARPLA